MIIKKFQAATENEAIEKAKEELGSSAVVMSIKTMKPKGIFTLFKKTIVEVTAAIEDAQETPQKDTKPAMDKKVSSFKKDGNLGSGDSKVAKEEKATRMIQQLIESQESKEKPVSAIEEKLNNLTTMLEQQIEEEKKNEKKNEKLSEEEKQAMIDQQRNASKEDSPFVKLLYNQFISNEVDEQYAHMLIDELRDSFTNDKAVDTLLANVYQKLVLKLGEANGIQLSQDKKPNVCFFVGSTGVGKTTTIAKIASMYKLQKQAKIVLLTADTYRIAAVEQLKTYAGILSIPIRVIYSPEEMQKAIEDYKDYDLILVDTAGRSHKNAKQRDELSALLGSIEKYNKEIYLVLSATTKYRDLIHIVNTYSDMTDFKLIFTKLDETSCYGNIFNIRMLTGADLSYVTCGQVVPDDISTFDAQSVAKQLLGGNE